MDHALLTELIALQQQAVLERHVHETEMLELALADEPRLGVRGTVARLLTAIAMRLDAAASRRALTANR